MTESLARRAVTRQAEGEESASHTSSLVVPYLPALTASPEPASGSDIEMDLSADVGEGFSSIRRPRRTREILELDSDDEEGSLFSRSVENGESARARRRRRIISEFTEEIEQTYRQRQGARERAQRPQDSSTPFRPFSTGWSNGPPPASEQQSVSTLLASASQPPFRSEEEQEWQNRIDSARLRRTTANSALLSMASQSNASSPLLHLFCAGCRTRVCSRALESNVLHGHSPADRLESPRRSRLTRCFTSDGPPPAQHVGPLGPPERVKPEDSTTTQWDGCACIRVKTGCTGCGNHIGHVVLTPCALCLRDVAGGHVFLFLPGSVLVARRTRQVAQDMLAEDAEPGVVPSEPALCLTWSSTSLPSRGDDFAAGLVGDPCDWLIGSSSTNQAAASALNAASTSHSRLPFWLLKGRSATLPPFERVSSLVRPSVSYSGALSRTPALRNPAADSDTPVRPPRPRFDLEDPDGIDVHSICGPLDFGSLSRAQSSQESRASRADIGLFSTFSSSVGR